MKKYILTSFLIALITISCQGCYFGTSGSWKDDHIDAKIRHEIAICNKKLFGAIANNDLHTVKSLMSPVLIEKGGSKLDSLISSFSDGFKSTQYKVLNEFYTKNTTANIGEISPLSRHKF